MLWPYFQFSFMFYCCNAHVLDVMTILLFFCGQNKVNYNYINLVILILFYIIKLFVNLYINTIKKNVVLPICIYYVNKEKCSNANLNYHPGNILNFLYILFMIVRYARYHLELKSR